MLGRALSPKNVVDKRNEEMVTFGCCNTAGAKAETLAATNTKAKTLQIDEVQKSVMLLSTQIAQGWTTLINCKQANSNLSSRDDDARSNSRTSSANSYVLVAS